MDVVYKNAETQGIFVLTTESLYDTMSREFVAILLQLAQLKCFLL